MLVVKTENLMCAGCENIECEHYTIYRGCLLCSYCLEDWLDYNEYPDEIQFHRWLIKQRKKMREDRAS